MIEKSLHRFSVKLKLPSNVTKQQIVEFKQFEFTYKDVYQ